MGGRNGQVHLSTYVPCDVATAFQNWARRTDGGTAGALRRLIAQTVDAANATEGLHGASPAQKLIAPRGIGRGQQIGFRLQPSERAALDAAARQATMSPANWVRSLVLVHLTHHPQWTETELEALRDLFGVLRGIATTIDQIARDAKASSPANSEATDPNRAALAAADLVRDEMRRLVAIMTDHFDYWGLPDTQHPAAPTGAAGRARSTVEAIATRKAPVRRSPSGFKDP